jgi:hypothetical protein
MLVLEKVSTQMGFSKERLQYARTPSAHTREMKVAVRARRMDSSMQIAHAGLPWGV